MLVTLFVSSSHMVCLFFFFFFFFFLFFFFFFFYLFYDYLSTGCILKMYLLFGVEVLSSSEESCVLMLCSLWLLSMNLCAV